MRAFGMILLAVLIPLAASSTAAAGDLSAADRVSITAQLETYRSGWLAGDAATIQALFLPAAVFLPHHGLEPVVGLESLRAFWWPGSGPKTVILRFDLETTKIEGTAELAYAWGRQHLEWSQEDERGRVRFRTHGNHLTVFRRTADGWKIALQAGDDVPNERF
jgi:ketosteroid isomerase-like protein